MHRGKLNKYSKAYYQEHKEERRAQRREGKEEYYNYKERAKSLLAQLDTLRKENVQLL